nr:NADH dehydrogenase subunit 4L [Diplatys flavicollis]
MYMMFNHLMIMASSLIMMSLIMIALQHKHLLSTLLALEFAILSTFMLMMTIFSKNINELSFTMIFITITACEGAIGLAILVTLIRNHGNDMFKTFSSL